MEMKRVLCKRLLILKDDVREGKGGGGVSERPYTYYNGDGVVGNVYRSEGSQGVASRPSEKDRLLAS